MRSKPNYAGQCREEDKETQEQQQVLMRTRRVTVITHCHSAKALGTDCSLLVYHGYGLQKKARREVLSCTCTAVVAEPCAAWPVPVSSFHGCPAPPGAVKGSSVCSQREGMRSEL